MKDASTCFPRLPIGLSFYSFALVGLNSGAGGVILKSLSTFYHVGDAVLGTLFFVSALSYALSSFFCGPLTERLSLRWLLVLGTALFLLGTVGYILEVPFLLLFVFRLCMGLGIGIIETGFNIFICMLRGRPSLLTSLHAFYGVGLIIGPLMATGMLSLLWGWNSIYMALALLNLLQLGGILLLLGGRSSEKGTSQELAPAQRTSFREVLALPLVWLAALFLLVYTGVEICASNWGYTYLIEQQGLGTLGAGLVVGGFGIGLTLGRFLIQPLAERRGIGVAGLMFALICAAMLSVLLTWLIPSHLLAGASFCLLGLSLAPIYPLTVALVPRLVSALLVPGAIGVLVSVSISGLSVLPWLAGVLAQVQGMWTLMPYMLVLLLVLLVLWLYLARPVSAAESVHKEQAA